MVTTRNNKLSPLATVDTLLFALTLDLGYEVAGFPTSGAIFSSRAFPDVSARSEVLAVAPD